MWFDCLGELSRCLTQTARDLETLGEREARLLNAVKTPDSSHDAAGRKKGEDTLAQSLCILRCRLFSCHCLLGQLPSLNGSKSSTKDTRLAPETELERAIRGYQHRTEGMKQTNARKMGGIAMMQVFSCPVLLKSLVILHKVPTQRGDP